MKLYLITQNLNNGWDTYDSAVVAAKSPRAAQLTHPDWCDTKSPWNGKEKDHYGCWVDADLVLVDYLGPAKKGTKAGVICASFNAG